MIKERITKSVLKEMWEQGHVERGMGDLKVETAVSLTLQNIKKNGLGSLVENE